MTKLLIIVPYYPCLSKKIWYQKQNVFCIIDVSKELS